MLFSIVAAPVDTSTNTVRGFPFLQTLSSILNFKLFDDGHSDQGEGETENEMVGWHHQLDGHEFEQVLGVSDGQGTLT